jgi:hypothetical protein
MEDFIEFPLMTFDLCRKSSPLSLSVTSDAFITTISSTSSSHAELLSTVEAGQLWLLSPGHCQIEITVYVDYVPIGNIALGSEFLEYLKNVICHCSVSLSHQPEPA